MYRHLLHYADKGVRSAITYVGVVRVQWAQGANKRTVTAFALVGIVALFFYITLIAPPSGFPAQTLISIPEGTPLKDAGNILEQKQIIRNSQSFQVLVRSLGRAGDIRAGDYVFAQPRDLFSIVQAVTSGQYGLEPIRFVVHEGATVKEMAKLFSKHLERVDEESFVRLALTHEGYLYPDTYFFLPNARETTIIRTMRENFDAKIEPLRTKIDSFGMPLDDIVTMASLLEREARIAKDRQMIAGVLWRRLDKGMLLQVDAAFLYSLGRTTFDLTRNDLQSDSPYNTYKNKGLPPTPIGSPSIRSIEAAITPIDGGYYFYLADRSGVTHYSKTYEEHLVKKRRYLGT